MTLIGRKILLTNTDASGNPTLDFPITSIECVEGADELVKSVIVDFPIGYRYLHWGNSVPVGRLPAIGALYDRELYANLWETANANGEVITEAEWQTQATANGGNCAYYSDGDGSTTFRVPCMKCWVRGASGVEEVGTYLGAGLPNITSGSNWLITIGGTTEKPVSSTLIADGCMTTPAVSSKVEGHDTNDHVFPYSRIDASLSSPIYGNSDTVQPPSLVGMWLIVAYGVTHNIGEVDVANVMQAVERLQADVTRIIATLEL